MPKTRTPICLPADVPLRFQLMPGAEDILRGGAVFGPATARVHQITTYYDTLDQTLFLAGLTLQIRQDGRDFIQTVKSRDTAAGHAKSRKQWQWAVENFRPDIGKMQQVPHLATAATLAAGRLEPIFVTDVWRTRGLVDLAEGTVAKATLDTGHILAGDLSEPISEIRLELKKGPVAPLFALALRLVDAAPIWLSAQGKASRGWFLHNGMGSGALTLPKLVIDPDLPVRAGLRHIIGALLGHLAANVSATLAGDPEALRQMRGALRQLRAVFRLFRPLLDKRDVSRFVVPLQQFARTFGTARDWDVFCLQTLPAAAIDLPQQDWTDLAELAGLKRVDAHVAVTGSICGTQLTRLMLELAQWADLLVNAPQDVGKHRRRRRLSKVAPALLQSAAARAGRAGRHPTHLSMTALHDFRKALDRLNVAIRFLGAPFPAQTVTAFRKRSDAVRDIIGAANDAEVTRSLVGTLATDGGHTVTASADALCVWAGQRQAIALIGLQQAAHRFRKAPAFWHG